MKRALIFNSAFLIFNSFCFAQTDTLYYNQDWEGSTKENASFYRLIKKENNLFLVEDHYKNNVLQMSGSFSSLNPELYEGYFKYYSEKGLLNKEGLFTKNVEEGEWKLYYDDGKPLRVENYLNGNLEGNLKSYYPNGQLRRDEDYKSGKLLKGKCYTPAGKDTAFFSSYKTPEYTGGLAALKKYMKENNKYPKDALEQKVEGTVFVKFTVTATGNIENAEVQKPVFPSLDEEALRLVKNMPQWQPGKKNDMPQRVLFNIPIYFKLNEAKTETKEK
ncbi:MAG TPA: TonB family protein [Bacteroidia bacterium]